MITQTGRNASTRYAQPCSCGCAPCVDPCCELEGQLRPRFFCGQLLTDEDLTSMVSWTAGKFRLQRFRTGWGVACGLDVRCDPAAPRGVIVGAGYAVSCCGDDIVVCADEKLDLSAALREEDPCADPAALVVAAEAEQERLRKRAELIDQAGRGGSAGPGVIAAMRDQLQQPGQRPVNGVDVAVRRVDVFVAYAELDADPRATLRHSDCVEAPECEAAKTRESFQLHWQLSDVADPAETAAEAWCRDYQRCLDVLHRFVQEFGSEITDWSGPRRWLVEWIERHPPHVFCELRELICALTDEQLAERHLEILTQLVVECRATHTRKPCHTCERASGVRLARVYLGQVVADAPARVLYIDNHPPFHRRLSQAGLPAPVGATNLGALIGTRWPEACQRLADLGVPATRRVLDLRELGQAADLLERLDCGCDPVVACGQRIDVLLAQFRFGKEDEDGWQTGERVVGFCASDTSADPGDAAPVDSGDAAPAGPGDADSAEPGQGERDADERRRTVEQERLKEANGIGDVLAERLVDGGLTLEIIATAPEEQRPELVARVQRLLPPMFRSRVPRLVAELRRIWAADRARLGG